MDERVLKDFQKGIELDDLIIQGEEKEEGRISRQWYLPVFLKWRGKKKRIFILSVYFGKKPYYKPWVELFGLTGPFKLEGKKFSFFDSGVEEKVLDKISSYQSAGERIFIEYSQDEETRYGLSRGFPAVVTKLGYKLFEKGYTWFKDWYFPEGFNEGGEKLQAEKPVDEEHRVKHMSIIEDELEVFLEGEKTEEDESKINARERSERIKSSLEYYNQT